MFGMRDPMIIWPNITIVLVGNYCIYRRTLAGVLVFNVQ